MGDERFIAGFGVGSTYTVEFSAIKLDGIDRVADIARSAVTKAFNAARKKTQIEIQSYLIRRIMEHPDIQDLTEGTKLVKALGIADPSSISSALQSSLREHMIGSTKGIGRGSTPEGKSTSNKLPVVSHGITARGKEALAQEPFGSYKSYRQRRARGILGRHVGGKEQVTSTIPWLEWLIFPDRGRVMGFSVEEGDFPRTRSGGARMKKFGSFSIRNWTTAGASNFLDDTLARPGVLKHIREVFIRAFDFEIGSAWEAAKRGKSGGVQEKSFSQFGGSGGGGLDIDSHATTSDASSDYPEDMSEAARVIDAYAKLVYKETGGEILEDVRQMWVTMGSQFGMTSVTEQIQSDALGRGMKFG